MPNISIENLKKHAETAKINCPVPKALAGPKIMMKIKMLK